MNSEEKNYLLTKIDLLHTTPLGVMRMQRNLETNLDPVEFCKTCLKNQDSIVYLQGKNYYLKLEKDTTPILFTINRYSYTIITAKKGIKYGNKKDA
jgi:hypothetical protein